MATEYSAKDCLPFEKADDNVLSGFDRLFLEKQLSDDNPFVFSLTDKRKRDDDDHFAQKKYVLEKSENGDSKGEWKWFAGRWIGSAVHEKHTITVTPRFGMGPLCLMLSEILHLKISESAVGKITSVQSLFSLLIPYIWEHKLAEANRYGLPRHNVAVYHKGIGVRGRLDVRKSIIPLFVEQQVWSVSREKQVDAVVGNILLQAEKILLRNKNWKGASAPNAKAAIDALHSADIAPKRLTDSDYSHIRYKSIYESYRPIVDLSWQIIKHPHLSHTPESDQPSYGAFFDMAEIWECYLREILRQAFPEWSVESPSVQVYDGQFYSRLIIPDIVLTKGDDVMVFDAKWKQMRADKTDVAHSDLDRSDFFQIHTYIQYYEKLGENVRVAGLLYPLSVDFPKEKNMYADSLFGLSNYSGKKTKFIVDGICVKEKEDENEAKSAKKEEKEEAARREFVNDRNNFAAATADFLDRLKNLLGESLSEQQNSPMD